MGSRPTIADIAREAGVGVATVDRVLNRRPGVREATALRVAEAARRIGYHAGALATLGAAADRPVLRIGVVLHKGRQDFYQSFAATLRATVAARTDVDCRLDIRFSPSQSPEDFATLIREVAAGADMVASSALNHPLLSRVAGELRAEGIPVFALLNDFAQGVRHSFLGLNNMQAGRIAGWMTATALRAPSTLAVFVGGNRWHGHVLRETGFRAYLREAAPEHRVLDTLVNLETRQVSYEATLDLLSRHPDLRGLYVAGGGMEGAIAAMRELRPPGKVVMVVNELTGISRAALADGYVTMVVATPLDTLCRDLVDMMIALHRDDPGRPAGQHFLEPRIHLPESV